MVSQRVHIAMVYLLMITVAAQAQLTSSSDTVRTSMVYLEHSETLSFDEKRLPDAQILKGDVCFRHDSALMYCDSAYFFDKENSLHAFGHVHLVQGDSIEGFGDMLFYNGNTRMARLRRHVRLIHQQTTLTTDSLNYDRLRNIAYYFTGGSIRDSLNTLTSQWGQYTPDSYRALFRGKVELVNPKFTLTADTLCYNTDSHQADLVGPTEIVYEKETTIFSTKGWYNTETELSMLLNRSRIVHNDGKTLTGDTIYYDKHAGYGKTIGNIATHDSINHLSLYGQFCEMWEDGQHGYVTDSAMMIDWSDSLNYTYMHADTLYTEQVPYRVFTLQARDSMLVDSVMVYQPADTLWKDTAYRQMRAFYHVRIYREDLQAVCDSMLYHGRDSIITLFGTPICWNDVNQISADKIDIHVLNQTIDHLHGTGNAIAIKQEGENAYDQLGGKDIYAYILDNEVYLIDVQGNAETIFYPREDDGTFIGVNRTQSSFVKLYIEDRKIHHVVFTTSSSGVMYPLDQVSDAETRLGTFFWADAERPRIPGDIFLHPQRTIRPQAGSVSASTEEEEEQTEEDQTPRSQKRKNKRK